MGDKIVFHDSLRYGSGELFSELRDSAAVSLHSAVEQMLAASDNTASLWLQAMVTGEGINAWLADNGFDSTRVNSRVPGRRSDWETYGWGQTTPREMTEIVRRIVEGRAVSPAADLEMHRLLTRTHWDDEAIASLPPSIQAASKQGAVSESKSEVVYVHAPSGPYVFTVVTKRAGRRRVRAGQRGLRPDPRDEHAVLEHVRARLAVATAGRNRAVQLLAVLEVEFAQASSRSGTDRRMLLEVDRLRCPTSDSAASRSRNRIDVADPVDATRSMRRLEDHEQARARERRRPSNMTIKPAARITTWSRDDAAVRLPHLDDPSSRPFVSPRTM